MKPWYSHVSVGGYLSSKTLPDGTEIPYFIDVKDGNVLLLHSSLTFLSYFSEKTSTESESHSRLLSYAAFQWPQHAQRAEADGRNERLAKVVEFLGVTSTDFGLVFGVNSWTLTQRTPLLSRRCVTAWQ